MLSGTLGAAHGLDSCRSESRQSVERRYIQQLRQELRREQEHIKLLEDRLAHSRRIRGAFEAQQEAAGPGTNWYLDRNFKIQLDYEVTRFTGGALAGNRPAERVLISQFALIF